MSILTPALDDAERLLVRALRRLMPPRSTVWKRVCMDCDRVFGMQSLPYEPEHGRETSSHGICDDCAEKRGLFDFDVHSPNQETAQ